MEEPGQVLWTKEDASAEIGRLINGLTSTLERVDPSDTRDSAANIIKELTIAETGVVNCYERMNLALRAMLARNNAMKSDQADIKGELDELKVRGFSLTRPYFC